MKKQNQFHTFCLTFFIARNYDAPLRIENSRTSKETGEKIGEEPNRT